MLKKPGDTESPKSKDDDDFDAGDDKDGDTGINVPVSRFQSKFMESKDKEPEEKKEKKERQKATGKDTIEDLINLGQERTYPVSFP